MSSNQSLHRIGSQSRNADRLRRLAEKLGVYGAISSAQTFLLKVVFVPFWIGSMSVATLPMFFGHASDHDHSLDPGTKWIYLAVWVVGSFLLYRSYVPLKRVALTDTDLRISNFRREIVVPLRDIDEVSEDRWSFGRHNITLRFRSRTEFGYEVVFMPKARPLAFLSPNPLVAKLRDAAAQARLDVKSSPQPRRMPSSMPRK